MSSVRSETEVMPSRMTVPPPQSLRSICTPVTTLFSSVTVVIFVLRSSQVIVWSKTIRLILSPSVALKSLIVSVP